MTVDLTMPAEDFRDWLTAMDMSAAKAAELLGVHPNTMTKYRSEGAPYHVALACSAVYHRLGPWKRR